MRPRIRYVYKRSAGYLGSTVMRAFQMSTLAKRLLKDRYDVGLIALPRLTFPGAEAAWIALQKPGTTYVFVKDAIDRLTPQGRLKLQRKAAGIAVDYVDRRIDLMVPTGVDQHWACSLTGLARMTAERDAKGHEGEVRLMLHNADDRLYTLSYNDPGRTAAVFFGRPDTTYMSERIAAIVTTLPAGTTKTFNENFRKVVDFNLHYCVRADYDRGLKPFTKGFNAAVCRANVIAHATEDDVPFFLDDDYPYLARTNAEPEIYEKLLHAQDSYGTAEWRRGLAAMAEIAARIAPERLAQDLDALFKELRS